MVDRSDHRKACEDVVWESGAWRGASVSSAPGPALRRPHTARVATPCAAQPVCGGLPSRVRRPRLSPRVRLPLLPSRVPGTVRCPVLRRGAEAPV